MKLKDMRGAVLLNGFCNIFGDDINGAKRVLGGLGEQAPERQWYCPSRYIGRYRMECEHGHRGQVMKLCGKHLREFGRSVTYCPRCNAEPPGHNCNLKLEMMS